MADKYQRTMHIMGYEPRANPGIPTSQQDNSLDVEDCSRAGSVPTIQGLATTDDQGRPSVDTYGMHKRVNEAAEKSFLEFKRNWT
eukprot:12931124-Prorocentrum_lima.AAC.1